MSPPTARERARRSILDRLLTTNLEPSDRVGLPRLARKLGTSVTPVREACTQLSYSGLLAYEPNLGFGVPALTASDARVLYNTVVALESEALRQAAPGAIETDALRAVNADFARARGPESRYRLDMAYHALLTVYYRDTPIERLLEDLKVRIYLYERAYLALAGSTAVSVELHTRIADHLDAGDTRAAAAALRQNWLNIEPVLAAAGLTSVTPAS